MKKIQDIFIIIFFISQETIALKKVELKYLLTWLCFGINPKMKTLVEMVVVWSPNMLNTQFLILVLLIISDERPY